MKSYEEFKETLMGIMKEKLGEAVELSIHTAVKNNLKEEQITIRFPEESLSPCVSIADLYEDYNEQQDLAPVIDRLMEYIKQKPVGIEKPMLTIEEARENLQFQVISKEKNEALLSECPYREIEGTDLVMILRWKCGEHASFLVKHGIAEHMEITEEELLALADDQLAREEWVFRSMAEVLSDMMGVLPQEIPEPDLPMYVLSNRTAEFGARVLMAPTVKEKIYEKLGSGFYIIPSSTHEVLVIPDSEDIEVSDLAAMVLEVNQTQVAPKDVLSDHVYWYGRKDVLTVLA